MTSLPVHNELSIETETKPLDMFMAIFRCHDIVTVFYESVYNDWKKIIP